MMIWFPFNIAVEMVGGIILLGSHELLRSSIIGVSHGYPIAGPPGQGTDPVTVIVVLATKKGSTPSTYSHRLMV
jgi:hypothetical protein